MSPERVEALIRQQKDSIYRQMVRVCNHVEDAEDALGGAILLALKFASQLDSEAAFRTWIGRIGQRVCSRMRKSPAVQQAWDFALENGLIDRASPEMDVTFLKGCISDAVANLPQKYRDVYLLCELEERTVPETAERLGISVAATKSRLFRAREQVRQQLENSICGM